MPGPISQSSRGPLSGIKSGWKSMLADQGFRYFVLKTKDVFAALDEEDLDQLNCILLKIEEYRRDLDKPASRSFWVFARHWKGASKVKALMEELLGIKVGEPYEIEN